MSVGEQGLVARYFSAMRRCDLEALMALFAAHPVLSVPDGRNFEGRAAIESWFRLLFGSVRPSPTCVSEVASARAIAAEIETKLPDGSVRRTANFFDLDERGAIVGLRSYARS